MTDQNWIRTTGTWFVYVTEPIDFGWEKLSPFKIEDLPEVVKKAARQLGWEGDGRCVQFVIPHGGSFEICLAWKQGNNGTSFVASPVALPHLEDSL
jgi:hypothetical protein